VCRHEVTTSVELKQLAPQFQAWYHEERLHSSLDYQAPWQRLLTDGAALTQWVEEFLGALPIKPQALRGTKVRKCLLLCG
jgi:hypothetical protein